MPTPYKVEELLTAAELGELRAFLRERRRTGDQTHEWLLGRGYTMSRSAACAWLARFNSDEAADRMRASSSVAVALMDAAREGGGVAVQDVAILQLGHAVIEKLSDRQSSGELSTDDIRDLALAMQRLTSGKARLEEVREGMRKATASALAEGEKAARSGASAGNVIDTVRSLLGIAIPSTESGQPGQSGQPGKGVA